VVINLAGAGVADERWSDERKQLLRDSRIAYTQRLIDAVKSRGAKPSVWLQGSAVGIYGSRDDEVLSDRGALQVPPREGPRKAAAFLSDLCVDWEGAAAPAVEAFGSRVVSLRIGIVQSARGGALAKMLPAFKFGAGGPLAGGKSWQAWVSLEDLLGQILFVVMNQGVSGAVNCVGPSPTTSLEYAKVLGKVLRRPAIAPLPAFALRAMFGELADGALLASQRAVPDRLTDAGFQFWHGTLESALRFTLGK
jgi:hypothetical protein